MLHGGDFGDAKAFVEMLSQIAVQSGDSNGSTATPIPEWDLAQPVLVATQSMHIHYPDKVDAGAGSEIPPLYLTRLIMFITKSRSAIKFTVTEELKKIMENPLFITDVIYLHEERGDDNNVDLNFVILRDFIDLQQGRGYLLDSGPDVTDWHNKAALLIPNPVFRKPLSELQQRKRGKKNVANGDGPEEMDENEPARDLINLE